LAPKLGMSTVADRMASEPVVGLRDRIDAFLDSHGEQPLTQVLVFANVWNVAGFRQRPLPPRTPGVHTYP